MALQTLTEAARKGTLRKQLNKYIKYCQCPTGTDSDRRPRRLFPNLAGFCYWMDCGMSAFDELKLTHSDEAERILCALENEALNARYMKVSVLMAYLRNRLGYDIPKKRSDSRNLTKDRDRPCKIEVYSTSQYEALFGTADPPPAQNTEPTPDPPPASPPEQAPRPLPLAQIAQIATPPPYSEHRIRRTAKRSTSPRSRPPPAGGRWSLITE